MENPVNPNLDPLIVSTINQIGEAMRKRFDEEEKPGYNSGTVFDMWWNGSMRGAPDFHNMAGFLTETAGYRYATPRCYSKEEIPDTFGERASNLDAKNPSTNYTNPLLGGCWPLRSAVDYMLTASRAVLTRRHAERGFPLQHLANGHAAESPRREGRGRTFAYAIDPRSATRSDRHTGEFLRTFRKGGIESAVRMRHQPPEAGSTRRHVRDRPTSLQAVRDRPRRRRRIRIGCSIPAVPPEPPYDMTGYELGLQNGRQGRPDHRAVPTPTHVVDTISPPAATTGSGVGVRARTQSHMAARAVNRLLKPELAWGGRCGTSRARRGSDIVQRQCPISVCDCRGDSRRGCESQF